MWKIDARNRADILSYNNKHRKENEEGSNGVKGNVPRPATRKRRCARVSTESNRGGEDGEGRGGDGKKVERAAQNTADLAARIGGEGGGSEERPRKKKVKCHLWTWRLILLVINVLCYGRVCLHPVLGVGLCGEIADQRCNIFLRRDKERAEGEWGGRKRCG